MQMPPGRRVRVGDEEIATSFGNGDGHRETAERCRYTADPLFRLT